MSVRSIKAAVLACVCLVTPAVAQTILGPAPVVKPVPPKLDVFDLTLAQTHTYSAAQNFELIGHDYFKIPERTDWAKAIGRDGKPTGSGLSSLKVDHGIAYLAGYNSPPTLFGVIIADVRNPKAMKSLAFIPCKSKTRCAILDVNVARHILVTANDTFDDPRNRAASRTERADAQAGWSFYDVSDPAHPRELGFLAGVTGGLTHGFSIDDRYVYACGQERADARSESLNIIDYADPAHPKKVGSWHVPGQFPGEDREPLNRLGRDGKQQVLRCHETTIVGDRLYVAWRDAGLKIFDVADRTAPRLIGTYDYIPPWTGGMLGATHSSVPVLVRPGEQPDLLLIADENYNCPNGTGRVVDISDMRNPEVTTRQREPNLETIATFRLPALTDRTGADGKFICPGRNIDTPTVTEANTVHSPIQSLQSPSLFFVTWYNQGLRAIDISNPFAPNFVGYYLSPKYSAWGNDDRRTREVAQDPATGLIYITDGNGGGLTALRYTGPVPSAPPSPGAR